MKKLNLISQDLAVLYTNGVIPDFFFVSLGNLLFSHTYFSKNILSPLFCLLIGAGSGEELRFFSLSLRYHSLTPSYISLGTCKFLIDKKEASKTSLLEVWRIPIQHYRLPLLCAREIQDLCDQAVHIGHAERNRLSEHVNILLLFITSQQRKKEEDKKKSKRYSNDNNWSTSCEQSIFKPQHNVHKYYLQDLKCVGW